MTLQELEQAYLHQLCCELFISSSQTWIPVTIQGFHVNKGYHDDIHGIPLVRVEPIHDVHIAQEVLDKEFTLIKTQGYLGKSRPDRYIKTLQDEDVVVRLRLRERTT